MKCNYYTRNYQRYYTCRGSGLTEQNGFHGQKLLGLLAAIRCNSISRSGNRNRDYDTWFAYIENIHFLFFFFFFKYCVYTYIFFSFTCFFRHVRREIAWLGRNRSFSLAFKKSLRKETAVAPILSFSSLEDINETVSRFNRNDEISIRFPGSKQDPILLSTMFA